MTGPNTGHLHNYACHHLGLKSYFRHPGDGRVQPQIPAQTLVWSMVAGQILRVSTFGRLERLVRSGVRTGLGVSTPFGDDTLAYFTEVLDPEVTREALVAILQHAKRNKAFENSWRIGLAVDGTGAGYTTKPACPLCHPLQDPDGHIGGRLHHFVMITVVGTGLTLPFDIEPYGPGDCEYNAGQRLIERSVARLGPRFADYLVVDGEFATAPFLHAAGKLGLPVVARLKGNLPELYAAAQARFVGRPPEVTFADGDDWVELWDAADFDPWQTLQWKTVRVMRYRQHKPDGTVVEAYWHTNFSPAALPPRSFYRLAKSRWEIENQGFNDGKNRYGMEPIRHHEADSMVVCWLLILLAILIERLYRLRYLHRGQHGVYTAVELVEILWLNLGSRSCPDTS
ncbi:MAG TPA: transposase [Bryobacteraceae bacterium]|nr:transposase [Bryobacteraceae bacterium]